MNFFNIPPDQLHPDILRYLVTCVACGGALNRDSTCDYCDKRN